MEPKEYGYIRVSTKEQNIDRQITALKDSGLKESQLFIDYQSGRDFDRPYYQKLLRKLGPGTTLYIKSIDRLGRNYDEILEQWRYITKQKKADIVVLDFPLLDTREKKDELTGKFIADLVLQVLSYVAQVERENTRQRQAEGIQEAKRRGVRFGRPKRAIPDNFEKVYDLWRDGVISKAEASRRLDTNNHTFTRWVEDFPSRQK
ncbi:MAG: recombinase family protein [Faecalimonas umbilicata]|uniref:recombinase family protein n=1 Tax=Faecalimonas umbilicata TaxID=1912855 RepID=UPI002A760B4B|nr:recombinase family protein [Faecalimonas umbilicata]MDY2762494.1 recombinase family protein [Faecalimonas umbilicata]